MQAANPRIASLRKVPLNDGLLFIRFSIKILAAPSLSGWLIGFCAQQYATLLVRGRLASQPGGIRVFFFVRGVVTHYREYSTKIASAMVPTRGAVPNISSHVGGEWYPSKVGFGFFLSPVEGWFF